MATRAGSRATQDSDITVISWTGLTQASSDVGSGQQTGDLSDLSVQAIGTFGAGGSVALQGSNDGTNWAAFATAIALTTTVVTPIPTIPKFIRPSVTAGDGTTSLTVTICAKKNM